MITLNKPLKFIDMFGATLIVTPTEFKFDSAARLDAKLNGDLCNGCGTIRVKYLLNDEEIGLIMPILLSRDTEFYIDDYSGYVEIPFVGAVKVSDLLLINNLVEEEAELNQ